mmetsp:Transcript_28513/g.43760  ORF Transcript_28513/g.43760 Transcript_28513/m.43760 type:complete len:663 (-) Transcript_28513:60-2048(-)
MVLSPPTTRTAPPVDGSSLSNPQEILVTHLNWIAHVDFENSTLTAKATYDIHRFDPNASTLCLDTTQLIIESAHIPVQGEQKATTYKLEKPHPHLGQRLVIDVGTDTEKVTISYKTTLKSSALQWLPPSQTAGKKYPYLFTQCQAIHARSLVPCQDQPGVKMTYSAKVTVPSWATCVMSALHQNDIMVSVDNNTQQKVCAWDQPVPIPSYLLAMAVGELESIKLSDRVCIWSEPSVVKAAAYEFEETEEFLKTAELIARCPYPWGRYDLLCLPPSFPYGGMENPCLTFVTPTLLAGDRSLADVVAHEISHSWTGNLVTNATWEHFWLNEGWTVWLQRKIMVRMVNDEKFLDFDAIGGWKALEESVNLMPKEYSKLVPNLGDQDPDDAFSSVPYEKGFNLLLALERQVGTPQFEEFFQDYIAEFSYTTVTSQQFQTFFMSKFPNAVVDWDTWFHASGMPPETPNFDRTLSEASENLASAWVAVDHGGSDGEQPPIPNVDLKDWSSNQIVCFLDALQSLTQDQPLKLTTLSAMKEQYGMASSQNSEILFRFCMLSIAANDESILPVALRFTTTQGRMKYVRPLYRALYHSAMGRKVAVETFLKYKDMYHPICSKMVATDLSQNILSERKNKKSASSSKGGSQLFWLAAIVGLASVGVVLMRRRR